MSDNTRSTLSADDLEIDEQGNLIIKKLDPEALEALKRKLADARVGTGAQAGKFRIEAII